MSCLKRALPTKSSALMWWRHLLLVIAVLDTVQAAGFTVLFGAPLGSAFFALEILHRRGLQYYEALVPAIVGSLCGYGVYLGLSGLGVGPVWTFRTSVPCASATWESQSRSAWRAPPERGSSA